MKKLLAVAVLLFAAPALATCTFSTVRGAIKMEVCTTGTEANALLATDGISLGSNSGFLLHVEAASAMTAGGVLQAYLYNPVSQQWNRAPAYDLTVQALSSQAIPILSVIGQQIAYLPNGVGLAVTIYMLPTTPRG